MVSSNGTSRRVHVCVCALRADAGRILPRLREQGRLLFIDNIFRFTQAGSEVSAVLGRMPSASGYQPTLGTEMGDLQERNTSDQARFDQSVQAVYGAPTRITDPARHDVHATWTADCVVRRFPNWAYIPPSIRSPRPRAFPIRWWSARNTIRTRRGVQRSCTLQGPQDIIAILGMEEWSEEDKLTVRGRAKIQRFLSQPNFVAEQFTGIPASTCAIGDTVRSFREILRRQA